MRTIKSIILLLVMIIAMPACTHNDGDIGDYFGRWKLTRITLNGDERVYNFDNVFWCFQSDIIEIDIVDETYHDKERYYGTFFYDDDSLILDFGHGDNNTAAGTGGYASPYGMFLENEVNILDVVSQSGDEMHLRYVKDDYVADYYLIKWN